MKISEIRKKILEWQDIHSSYLNEVKTLIVENNVAKELNVISYFTYSLNIYHHPGRENFCLGSFHIQNLGELPLTNPYICIKIASDSPFNFSGKYVYKDSKQKMRLTNAWERINDPTDKQEFWLKPTEKLNLEPFETITFPNFQVKWDPDSSYTGTINGFIYGDELEEGMNSFNQISINGTINEKMGDEEKYDDEL